MPRTHLTWTSRAYPWCILVLLSSAIPVCHGFPYLSLMAPDNNEYVSDSRSFSDYWKRNDGLRSPLCPSHLSKVRCLHSYLSLYHQIQNGITDPVALRNIGKRSIPFSKRGGLMCPNDMDRLECYNSAIEYYIKLVKMMS